MKIIAKKDPLGKKMLKSDATVQENFLKEMKEMKYRKKCIFMDSERTKG